MVRIQKEDILQTAFEIVRKEGMDKLSVRNIAKKMNCSVQPIYYQFKNFKELQKELCLKIEKYFYRFVMKHSNKDIPIYKQVGINYIKFAKSESKLFQILFMTESSLTPREFVTQDIEDFKELEKIINVSTNLSDDNLKEFHVKMWIFTHGIASLVANNTCNLTDDQISQLLTYGFQAFMLLEDKNK